MTAAVIQTGNFNGASPIQEIGRQADWQDAAYAFMHVPSDLVL